MWLQLLDSGAVADCVGFHLGFGAVGAGTGSQPKSDSVSAYLGRLWILAQLVVRDADTPEAGGHPDKVVLGR